MIIIFYLKFTSVMGDYKCCWYPDLCHTDVLVYGGDMGEDRYGRQFLESLLR